MNAKNVTKLYGRKDTLTKILTFDDLEFKEHPIAVSAKYIKENYPDLFEKLKDTLDMQIGATYAYVKFANNRHISVIFGECFYSDGKTTYECMESYTNEPEGYCTPEQVTKIMADIQAKPVYVDELEEL